MLLLVSMKSLSDQIFSADFSCQLLTNLMCIDFERHKQDQEMGSGQV